MNKRITVFCASSTKSKQHYIDAAFKLGMVIATRGDILVYGGGKNGLMGAVSDGALSIGGKVVGIIPEFMMNLEWGRDDIHTLELTETMEHRKLRMIEGSDAIVTLPGGSGTMEELYQVLTMKRLGYYLNPVVIVNAAGFFDKWLEFMDLTVEENFLGSDHLKMYTVVNSPGEIYDAIEDAEAWGDDHVSKALV